MDDLVVPASTALVEVSRQIGARHIGVRRKDGWANILTGLGDANRDKLLSNAYYSPTILAPAYLDNLYQGDDVVARIVDRPGDEMTREWIEIAHDGDAEEVKNLTASLDEMHLRDDFADALAWSRLHGGSVMLLGIEDGQPPDKPVDESRIKSFDWINVLDRWEIQIAAYSQDANAEDFGRPSHYKIVSSLMNQNNVPFGAIIHASRVLRFDGVRTSRRHIVRNAGWANSIINRVYPVIRDFATAFGGMAHLLSDFGQAVLKIKGLANKIDSDSDNLVLQRIALLDMARSMARIIPLDADGEEFERKATPVSGLPELLDRMGERLSLATDMPITMLMGRSPAGMNATGESDIRLWYDKLSSQQEVMLRRPIQRVLKLKQLAKNGPTGGREIKNWSFRFCDLMRMNDVQVADIRYKQAQTDQIYILQGVIDPEEVRRSRFSGDKWSAETQLDPKFDEQNRLLDTARSRASTDPNAPEPGPGMPGVPPSVGGGMPAGVGGTAPGPDVGALPGGPVGV